MTVVQHTLYFLRLVGRSPALRPERPRARRKFVYSRALKSYAWRGLAYRTFRPYQDRDSFPRPEVVDADFALKADRDERFGYENVDYGPPTRTKPSPGSTDSV
jgi:hypothetical protein